MATRSSSASGKCDNNVCGGHSKNQIISDLSKQRTKGVALVNAATEIASGIAELITGILDLVTQQWVRAGIDGTAFLAHIVAGAVDLMTATGQQIPSWLATVESIAHAVAEVADFVSEAADLISIVFPGRALGDLAENLLDKLEPVARFKSPKVILQTLASTFDLGNGIFENISEQAWNQTQQKINNLSPQDAFNQCIATHPVAVCS